MATKLSKSQLTDLFNKISSSSEKAYGEYIFEELKIFVKRKNPLSVNERSKRLYDKRRNAGECVVCGVKVTKKNPLTDQLYRSCDKHRKEELTKKRLKRSSSIKKTSKSKKK